MPDDLTYRIKIDKDEALRDIREIRDEIQKATSSQITVKGQGGSGVSSSSGSSGSGFSGFGNPLKLAAAFSLLGPVNQVGGSIREMGMQTVLNNIPGLREGVSDVTRPLRVQQQMIGMMGMGAGFMDPKDIRDVSKVFNQIEKMRDDGATAILRETGGLNATTQAGQNLSERSGMQAVGGMLQQAIEAWDNVAKNISSMFNGT